MAPALLVFLPRSLTRLRRSFWDSLTQLICNAPIGHHVSLLIDGNARVGSVVSHTIGTANPEIENDNGSRFRNLLETSGLCASSTFYDAVGKTWRHSSGKAYRIDHIVTSRLLHSMVRRASTLDKVDVAPGPAKGHTAVAARLTAPNPTNTPRRPKPSRKIIDVSAAKDLALMW